MSDSYVSAKLRLGTKAGHETYRPPKARHNHDDRGSSSGYTNEEARRSLRSYDDRDADIFGDGKKSKSKSKHNGYEERGSRDKYDKYEHSNRYDNKKHDKFHRSKSDRYENSSKKLLTVKKNLPPPRSGSGRGRGPSRGYPKTAYSSSRFDMKNTVSPFKKFNASDRGRGGSFSRGRGRGGFDASNKRLKPIDEDELKQYLGEKYLAELDALDLSSIEKDDFWSGKMRKLDITQKQDVEAVGKLVKVGKRILGGCPEIFDSFTGFRKLRSSVQMGSSILFPQPVIFHGRSFTSKITQLITQ